MCFNRWRKKMRLSKCENKNNSIILLMKLCCQRKFKLVPILMHLFNAEPFS